ncbi:hypothetical protein P869_06905 [Ligilactobacillus ruminis S23]|nr:hypothetical protein P869_06905 [Ligilactobacillus ruminis S23]
MRKTQYWMEARLVPIMFFAAIGIFFDIRFKACNKESNQCKY